MAASTLDGKMSFTRRRGNTQRPTSGLALGATANVIPESKGAGPVDWRRDNGSGAVRQVDVMTWNVRAERG